MHVQSIQMEVQANREQVVRDLIRNEELLRTVDLMALIDDASRENNPTVQKLLEQVILIKCCQNPEQLTFVISTLPSEITEAISLAINRTMISLVELCTHSHNYKINLILDNYVRICADATPLLTQQYLDVVQKYLFGLTVNKTFLVPYIQLFRNNIYRIRCIRIFTIHQNRYFSQSVYVDLLLLILEFMPDDIQYSVQLRKIKRISEVECRVFLELVQQLIEFLICGYNQGDSNIKTLIVKYLVNFLAIPQIFFKVLLIIHDFHWYNASVINKIICFLPEELLSAQQEVLMRQSYKYILDNQPTVFYSQTISNLKLLFYEWNQLQFKSISKCICLISNLRQGQELFLMEAILLLQNLAENMPQMHIYMVKNILGILCCYPQVLSKIKSLRKAVFEIIISDVKNYYESVISLFGFNMVNSDLIRKLQQNIQHINNTQHRCQLWKIIIESFIMRQYNHKNDYGLVNLLGVQAYGEKWIINLENSRKYYQEFRLTNQQQQIYYIQMLLSKY